MIGKKVFNVDEYENIDEWPFGESNTCASSLFEKQTFNIRLIKVSITCTNQTRAMKNLPCLTAKEGKLFYKYG